MSAYMPFPPDYPIRQELVEYSRAVLAGGVPACQKHKWACQRFLQDLEREGTNAFPFVFDEAAALRFLSWMRLFRHRKGVLAGERIDPHIIQRFIFGNIYGWRHMETGYRRFRKAYWQVGRKNAKSQSLACVGTYELMAFGAGASEVYCAATKKEQARIVWTEAEKMMRQCRELEGAFRVAYHKIEHLPTGSVMAALSKEDRKEGDGFNPQCAIIDEYHAHDTAEIYDILDSGMGARPEPLLVVITTAGYELNHPCYRIEYQYVSQILEPDSGVENEQYFVMINELDRDEGGELLDDIKDESVWVKANPILASYDVGLDYLRGQLQAALDAPEKMRTFLTKNMNVWLDQREAGYMNMGKWKACAASEDNPMPDLTGKECYVGVDLSAKIDLTSVAVEFPLGDGKYALITHSFIPADRLRERMATDKMPFDLWAKQGWLTTIPGAVVDQQVIIDWIETMAAENGWVVREVCVDPWNATQFNIELQKLNYVVAEIIQGHRTLSEPTKNFRERVLEGKVIHNGSPVTSWAMGNAVTRPDHNGNIMLDKSKSRERIDPAAAIMNAHTRAMHGEVGIYDPNKYADEAVLDVLWG